MIKFLLKDANSEARMTAHQVQFVLRAIGKDQIKPIFTTLLSDGKIIVCCDSRRLHSAPVVIPAGIYDVIKSTATEIILEVSDVEGQYPPYEKVMCLDRDNFVPLEKFDSKYTGGAKTLFQIAQAGFCLNVHFVGDACKGAENLQVSFGVTNAPVVITSELGRAVLMPIETNTRAPK